MSLKRIFCILAVLMVLSADYTARAEEQFQFVAEVGRLMDIIINSLYTQKEIFLRELISNASDALDKIRFLAISDPGVLGSETELEIKVQANEADKTVDIIDNGIGMTKNDLINNLGTVAKSGTTSFIEALEHGDMNLIGQFGVGFYSSFLAASKVEVISKHNDDKQYKWTSSATNSFTIEEDNSVELKRGTIVRLHLKEDAQEYLQPSELETLIQRYSSFINYPIYLQKKVSQEEKHEKTEEEIEVEKKELIAKYESEGKEVDLDEIENEIQRTVTTIKDGFKFERMNENKPLWVREKKDLNKDDYNDFYKAVFKENSNPLTWSHFKAEGDADFTALLYVPERSNFDQFDKFYEKKSQVKLFVRRVLINDEFEELLPKYLNFLKGIVDSDSLPLNVNRESLQQRKTLTTIGNKLLKKAVDMLVEFNPSPVDEDEELFSDDDEETKYEEEGFASKREKQIDTFNKFWKNYHKNIKLGMIEDESNRKRLAVLTRWYTTNNVTELTSLDDYISRMKEGQKHIYYLGGEDRNTLQYSPLIERLTSEGYEVILGDDPLDETIFTVFKEYNTYRIVNVARNDFKEPYKTDQERKEVKYLKQEFQPLIDYAKKELGSDIKDVKVSLRLVNNPVTIVADLNNATPNRERLEEAAALRQQYRYGKEKNVMEINPHHPMIQELNRIVEV